MGDFSRISNFNPQANYKFVRIGADCPVLEIELNEMQQISEQRLQNLVKTFVGEGVKGSGSYAYNEGVLTITNEEAIIDGVPLEITSLELNIAEGEKAYIQMWLQEVTYQDTLKYMGNVQETRTVENKILDTNIGKETSRRMQIQYDLVKDESLRSELNPVNLYVGKIEGGRFVLDSSLLKTFTNTKNVEKFLVDKDTTQFGIKGAYRVNSNSLQVFVDGIIQLMGYDEDYVEVNSNTFEFNTPVKKGSEVIAIYSNAVVSEERPNTHGSTHNASGDDPIDISDLADRFGVRDKLTKSSDVLEQLGNTIEEAEPLNASMNSNIDRINSENTRMEANIRNAQNTKTGLDNSNDLATTKKTELDNSLTEAKKYIENLDGSQNLPQMREDITTLQNGLKTNQNLEYEGTNLTCENTFEGRIEDIVLEGRTYQNLCTLKESIILDFSTSVRVKYIDWNFLSDEGEFTIIPQIKGDKSKIKAQIESNTGVIVGALDFSKGFITFNANTTKIKKIMFYVSSGDFIEGFNATLSNIIILKGNYEGKYIPPYFEGIKSVGEKEGKISILSSTSNLAESFKETVHLTRNTPTEYKKINATLKGVYYQGLVKDGEFIVPSGSTTINFYDENKTKIEWLTLNGKPRKFDWGDILLKAKYYTIFNSADDLVFDDVFIGKTSNYSISKIDKKEIPLPFESGFKGFSNGAKDMLEIRQDGLYAVQKVGRKVFNGTDEGTWNEASKTGTTRRFYLNPFTDKKQGVNNNLICDKLPTTLNYSDESIGVAGYDTDGRIYIKLPETVVTGTINDYLKDNNMIVYYELAEPIETKISDTKLSLDTYNSLTYVFSNNAISPNIKLKVASNLGSIIQQNARSINDIYKLIDEVLIPQIADNTTNIELLKLK